MGAVRAFIVLSCPIIIIYYVKGRVREKTKKKKYFCTPQPLQAYFLYKPKNAKQERANKIFFGSAFKR
jgi:hypothetical protein